MTDLEKILLDLDVSYREMTEESDRMGAVAQAAERKLKAVLLEAYPHFGEWDADLMRKVDEAVWRAADRVCRELEDANAEHARRRLA